jgi:hypothetical protein
MRRLGATRLSVFSLASAPTAIVAGARREAGRNPFIAAATASTWVGGVLEAAVDERG